MTNTSNREQQLLDATNRLLSVIEGEFINEDGDPTDEFVKAVFYANHATSNYQRGLAGKP